MLQLDAFHRLPLPGEFVVASLSKADKPLVDFLGRPILARTQIIGREFRMTIASGLSEKETSVTLYHEILEAMTIAVPVPPESVREFNERDFESAAYEAHDQFGVASPAIIIRMLQFFGFPEE